ncbi:bacteriophage holin [Lactococcus lactis]|uniref:bacteriophage holin n=1 Tax=Lactococcus lactis TaxID=1358 RepID=UPI0009BF2720|nr:bacteriophage holin [Lactococcus lactis]MCT0054883.1 hypothetical protein [Lactococcus lactis subsp. lactis]
MGPSRFPSQVTLLSFIIYKNSKKGKYHLLNIINVILALRGVFLYKTINKLYNYFIPKIHFFHKVYSLASLLLTGALFLCYNIFGMIVGFHPISRVKLLFGAAF